MPDIPAEASTCVDLSVIIVQWNQVDLLRRCLQSIFAQRHRHSIQVIVSDNSSTDGSPEMVEGEFPQVVLLRNGANLGFARANNAATPFATGRWILLLNSDTEIRDDALDVLIDAADADPEIGAIGPYTENPDGSLQPSGRYREPLWVDLAYTTSLHKLLGWPMSGRYYQSSRDYDHTSDVDILAGACMMVRRELWIALRGLDEHYFFYFEDADLCLSIRRLGWICRYYPAARVMHVWGASSGPGSVRIREAAVRGHIRFLQRHYGTPSALLLRTVIALNATPRVAIFAAAGVVRASARQRARWQWKLLRIAITPQPRDIPPA
jgi:GT2 family glycosyltransferase